MVNDIQMYKNQLDKFGHIQFIEDNHVYMIDGQAAPSVTSLLKNLLKPFDQEYWAKIKAHELKVSVEDILSKWQFNAQFAKTKGTLVHQFLESYLSNIQFTYPQELIIETFGYDPIQEPFQQIINIVQKFLNDIDNKMLPLFSEFVIGDREHIIGGTIDQLFYNKKSGQIEIWDWKTNKEIKLESRYFHLMPINHIPDTELDHYSLQLSLYKLIVERNTGLVLGNSYIAWFNEKLPAYRIYRAKDYKEEAKLILGAFRGV
ncbi:MAG: PD-(D/E)XK nuclease family protein [Burkholderiales bacterium]|nr:PD-(D/E)XK nuclease family protein [Burkholderiales bacterium]